MVAGPASAADRLQIRMGPAEGLDVQGVGEFLFDDDGALWAGTPAGIRRFDGGRFEAVDGDQPPKQFFHVTRRPGGGVYALDSGYDLFEVYEGVRRRVTDLPAPGPFRTLQTDAQGRLWLLGGGVVWRRDAPGQWSQPLIDVLVDGERPAGMRFEHRVPVVVTTRGAIAVGGDAIRRALTISLTPTDTVVDAIVGDDGDVVVVLFGGRVQRWRDDQLLREWKVIGRGISMLERGDSLWIAWDHKLGVLRPDGQLRVWRLPFGGVLRSAPDGAMVLGGEGGLFVYPEPDTVILDDVEGVPPSAVRFVEAHNDQIWLSSWRGPIVWDDERAETLTDGLFVAGKVCPDKDGIGWTMSHAWLPNRTGLFRWVPGGQVELVVPLADVRGCVSGPDGTVWLAGGGSMWRVDSGEPAVFDRLARSGTPLHLDRRGRFWFAVGGEVCRVEPASLSQEEAWNCFPVDREGPDYATDVLDLDTGTVLVTTHHGGLYRIVGRRIERHPRSDAVLGSRVLQAVEPSPRGGVWVAGKAVLARVDPDSLEIIEELGPWHGLRLSSAAGVVEMPNGDVWLATVTGPARVRAAARQRPEAPPRVQLSDVVVDGADQRVVAGVRLPPPPNRVQLGFTAPAYRDPDGLLYRVRLDGGPPRSLEGGRIQLVDLRPGRHRVAVEVSLDGERWSEPARATIQVAAFWWQSPWVYLVGLFGMSAALFLAYRARVAFLVAREKERTRIAMDLHDELGSGLGSIRLLASVLDRDDLSDDSRRDLADRIRVTAGELHGGVQELVGSLRPGGATVGALLDRLGERARDLLPDPDMDLRVVDPDEAAQVRLGLVVRRELERIGAEALHNAARHGRPRQVTVGVRSAGSRWVLWVRDDGRGFDPDVLDRRGLGLHSMQARAERIGADLVLESQPGRGTTVHVHFDPLPRSRR